MGVYSINFRLVEGFAEENFTHQVTIGGEAVTCQVNEGNTSVLTCRLPTTVKFPVTVQVDKDGSVVNEFEYSGSNCTIPVTPKSVEDVPDEEVEPVGGESAPVNCDPVHLPVCIPIP